MPSPTFQFKSITFVPYILASSSDSYDPKNIRCELHAPSNPAFFRYIFRPLKPETTRSCQNFTADLGISPWPAVATTARILDSWWINWRPCEKPTWNDTHEHEVDVFFDQIKKGLVEFSHLLNGNYMYCVFFCFWDSGLHIMVASDFCESAFLWLSLLSKSSDFNRISYLGIYL